MTIPIYSGTKINRLEHSIREILTKLSYKEYYNDSVDFIDRHKNIFMTGKDLIYQGCKLGQTIRKSFYPAIGVVLIANLRATAKNDNRMKGKLFSVYSGHYINIEFEKGGVLVGEDIPQFISGPCINIVKILSTVAPEKWSSTEFGINSLVSGLAFKSSELVGR